MKCTSCGAEVPFGSLFCTSCGTSVAASTSAQRASSASGSPCPNCGANVPAGYLFCTACGSSLVGGSSTGSTSGSGSSTPGGFAAVPFPGSNDPFGQRPAASDPFAQQPAAPAQPAASAPTVPPAAPTICWCCGQVVPQGAARCPICNADPNAIPKEKKKKGAAKTPKQQSGGGSGKSGSNTVLIAIVGVLGALIAAFAIMFFTGALDNLFGNRSEAAQPAVAEETQTEETVVESTPTPTPEPTETPEPEEEDEPDFLLPDSASRYLTEADLEDLTWRKLCLARNEIFARHGRLFVTPEIAEYFNSKPWYEGRYDEVTLNSIETANVNFILSYENRHFGGSYY